VVVQVADFQWHPTDPFTMVSVTDDNAGGTMHMWRINDLIYRPEQEVIKELEQYKSAPSPLSCFPSCLLRPAEHLLLVVESLYSSVFTGCPVWSGERDHAYAGERNLALLPVCMSCEELY